MVTDFIIHLLLRRSFRSAGNTITSQYAAARTTKTSAIRNADMVKCAQFC